MIELITLTTTWGLNDFYGNMLQHLLEKEFQIKTIVLSHSIPKYNNYEAAWQVKNAIHFLKVPTLHIIDTDSFYTNNQNRLWFKKDNHTILCKNNGLPSLLDYNQKNIYELQASKSDTIANILHQTKIVTSAGGENLPIAQKIKESVLPYAMEDAQSITGIILYEDAQGHLHTNISREEILNKGWNLEHIQVLTRKVGQIAFLLDKPKDQLLRSNEAILGYNLEGNLYLYFEQGDGASILGIKQGDYVKITYNQI